MSEETCGNCHRLIGALEEGFVWKDNIVCRECYERLSDAERPAPSTPVAPEAAPSQAPSAVYIQQSSKSTSGFGIAALVLGILACLTCWIPFIGILSIPLSGLGLLFGIIGILVSAIGGKSTLGMPIAGSAVSLIALVIAIVSTGVIVAAAGTASEVAERAAQVLEEESEDIEQPEAQPLFQPQPTPETTPPAVNPKNAVSKLPPHVFSSAPRGRRSQIRAVISKNAHTKLEIERIAIRLVSQNNLAPCLVQFFDNESCLRNWDGTGLLKDSDWPHWLGRARVDMNLAGLLSASFRLAVDEQTGQPRTDVFRQ